MIELIRVCFLTFNLSLTYVYLVSVVRRLNNK
jgi:hypothetical protein